MPYTESGAPYTPGIGASVGKVTIGGLDYQLVIQKPQQTVLATLLSNVTTATATSAVQSTDGLNGALVLVIQNGAGTCTVTVQGSVDNFASAQSALTLGVIQCTDSNVGTYTVRNIQSGAISVAANTTTYWAIQDPLPYMRVALSNGSGLGAGTNVTGCTVYLWGTPL